MKTSKMTEQERDKRRRKIQEEALELIAARGQFNFRLDGEYIKRLYALAGRRKKPVSTLVREWVLERLELEETGAPVSPPWAKSLEERIAHSEALIQKLFRAS